MGLLEDGQLAGQVAGADGGGSLMDDVFEEVRDAVLPHRLRHGADPDPQVGGHPGPAVVLDQQDGEAVVEHVLLDRERRGGDLGERRRTRQGGDRAGDNDDKLGFHGLSPVSDSGRFSHEVGLPVILNTATLVT